MKEINKESFKFAIIIAICSIAIIFAQNVSLDRWKNKQSEAVCYPTKKTWNYPFIAYMPQVNFEDPARFYSFIEDYVDRKYSESLDDYEKTSATTEFKMDYIKSKLEKLIYMSKDAEKYRNEELYFNSNTQYFKLNDCNCNFHFNIDAIESVNSLPKSGVVYVTVLGSFQISYWKNKPNSPVNAGVQGYKRIHLVVGIGGVDKSKKGSILNEYGYYVINSDMEDVSDTVREDLFKNKMILGWDNLPEEDVISIINGSMKKPEWGIE